MAPKFEKLASASAPVVAPTQRIRALAVLQGNEGVTSVFPAAFPAAKTNSVFEQAAELIAALVALDSAPPPKLPFTTRAFFLHA